MATREEKLRQWQESKRKPLSRSAQPRTAMGGKENAPYPEAPSQRKTRSMTAADNMAMPPPSKPPLSERNEKEPAAEADTGPSLAKPSTSASASAARGEDEAEPWRLNSIRESGARETEWSTPIQRAQMSMLSSGLSPIPMPNPDNCASITPLRSNMNPIMSGVGMTPQDTWTSSNFRNIPGMGRDSLGGNALSKLRARVDIMRRTSNMGYMATPMASSAPQLGKLDETEIGQGSEISIASTALFESEEFLEQCERVLVPSSTSKTGVQSRSVDLERSLRDVLQQVFAKKDAFVQKCIQVESELQGQVGSLTLQRDSEKQRADKFESQALKMRKLVEEAEKRLNQRHAEVESRLKSVTDAEEKLREQEATLEVERNKLDSKLRDEIMKDAEKRYAQKLTEIEREKAKVADLESEKNDIEQGLKHLSKESEDYRQRIEELEEANEALERQLRKSSQIKLQFEEYETEMQLKLQDLVNEMKNKEAALRKEFEMEKQTWELEREVMKEEVEARHLENVSKIESLWQSKIKEEIATAKEMVHQEITAQHAEEIDSLQQQWISEKDEEVKEAIRQEQQKYETKATSLREKGEKELESKISEQESIREELKVNLENEMRNLKSAHESTVEDLNCSWQNRLDEAQEGHNVAVEKLESEWKEALENLKGRYENEISKTQSESRQESDRIVEENKAEVERLQSMYEEEKKLAEEEYSAKLEAHLATIKEKGSNIDALSEQLRHLEEANKDWGTKVSQVEALRIASIEESEQSHSAKVAELEKKFKQELAGNHEAYTANISELEKRHTQQTEDAQLQHSKELEHIMKQHETKIARLQEESQNDIETLRRQKDREIAAMTNGKESEHQSAILDLTREMQRQKEDEIATSVKAAEERTWNLANAENERQLAELKSQMEMNAAKAKAVSLEEMREFHEQTVKGLRQELEEESKRAVQAEKAKERRILEETVADVTSKAKSERDSSLQELEQKLRDEFSGVLELEKQQRQREKEQLTDEYENLLSKQSKANERQIQELEENLKNSLASQKHRLNMTFETEKDEIEKKFSKELFYLKDNHETEQSRLTQEMQKALEAKETETQELCLRLKAEHNSEIRRLSEEYDKKVCELKDLNAKEMEIERKKALEQLENANKNSEAGLMETVQKMEQEAKALLENQAKELEASYKQREDEMTHKFNVEKEKQAEKYSQDSEIALRAADEAFQTKMSNELQKLAVERDKREQQLLEESAVAFEKEKGELKKSAEEEKTKTVQSLQQRFDQEIADVKEASRVEKEKSLNTLEAELVEKHEKAMLENQSLMLKEKEEALTLCQENAQMDMKAELDKQGSMWQEKTAAQIQSLKEEGERQRLRDVAAAQEEMAKKKDEDHELQLNNTVAELKQESSAKMSELRAELEGEKIQAVEAAVESTTSQLEELHRQSVASLKEESESNLKEKEIQWMRESDERLESAICDLKQEHEQNLESLKSELGGDLLQYKQTCAELEERMCGFKAAIDSEKEEVAALSERLHKKEEELIEAKQGQQREAVRYESEMVALKEEIQLMRDSAGKNDEARMNQLSQKCRDVEMAKSEIEILQKKIAELTENHRQVESALLDSEQTRRVLHNTIQELRGNVRVFCRIRPASQADPVVMPVDEGTGVRLAPTSTNAKDKQSNKQWSFGFDRVFDQNATQEDVFLEVEGLVQSALDGYKVCLFSYGQTGSGKTYTMQGTTTGSSRGIIPRAVEIVIETSQRFKAKGWDYSMEAAYVEIYNEQVRDLLSPGSLHSDKHTIVTARDGGCPVVSGVIREPVPSVDSAISLVRRAAAARAVESTKMNAQSSRSHTLFILYITGVHQAAGQKLSGCLVLVDLAGSERVARSGAQGARLKETCAINKSLSCLGDVFTAISNNQSHIPYRNSKLTHLLAPCLGGDGKTLMFVNVSPESKDSEETLCSLRFASHVNACELGLRNGGAKRNISSAPINDQSDNNEGGPKETPASKTLKRQSVAAGSRRMSTRRRVA